MQSRNAWCDRYVSITRGSVQGLVPRSLVAREIVVARAKSYFACVSGTGEEGEEAVGRGDENVRSTRHCAMMHQNAAGWTCFPPLPPGPAPTELGIDDTLKYIKSRQDYNIEQVELRKEMAAMWVALQAEKEKVKRDEAKSKQALLAFEAEMKRKDDELARLTRRSRNRRQNAVARESGERAGEPRCDQ